MAKKIVTDTKTKKGHKSLTTWRYKLFDSLDELTEYNKKVIYDPIDFINHQRLIIKAFLKKNKIPHEDKDYFVKIVDQKNALIDEKPYKISINEKDKISQPSYIQDGAEGGEIELPWMLETYFSHIPAVIPVAAALTHFGFAEAEINRDHTNNAVLEALRGMERMQSILIAHYEDFYHSQSISKEILDEGRKKGPQKRKINADKKKEALKSFAVDFFKLNPTATKNEAIDAMKNSSTKYKSYAEGYSKSTLGKIIEGCKDEALKELAKK